jgi:hypothetical protein
VADDALRDSVLRATAKAPGTFGFILARLREERRLTLGEQASALGLGESALVFLSVFRLPRPAHREADLAAAATAIGIEVGVLRRLLRDETREGVAATAPAGGAA